MAGEAILLGWMRQPSFPAAPEGTTPETLAMVWSWAIFGAATEWSRGKRGTSAGALAQEVTLTLSRTIGAA